MSERTNAQTHEKAVLVRMDAVTHRRLRVRAVEEDKTMSELVTAWLREKLGLPPLEPDSEPRAA